MINHSQIGSRNRDKGQELERWVVNTALAFGIDAFRCGQGQSSPLFPFADAIVNEIGIECKNGKQVSNWIRAEKFVPNKISNEMLRWFEQTPLVCVHGHKWNKEKETFLITLNPEHLKPLELNGPTIEKVGLYRVRYIEWLEAISEVSLLEQQP